MAPSILYLQNTILWKICAVDSILYLAFAIDSTEGIRSEVTGYFLYNIKIFNIVKQKACYRQKYEHIPGNNSYSKKKVPLVGGPLHTQSFP